MKEGQFLRGIPGWEIAEKKRKGEAKEMWVLTMRREVGDEC